MMDFLLNKHYATTIIVRCSINSHDTQLQSWKFYSELGIIKYAHMVQKYMDTAEYGIF